MIAATLITFAVMTAGSLDILLDGGKNMDIPPSAFWFVHFCTLASAFLTTMLIKTYKDA